MYSPGLKNSHKGNQEEILQAAAGEIPGARGFPQTKTPA